MGLDVQLRATTAAAALSPPVPKLHAYQLVPLIELKPNPRNARYHSKRQIREIERSYREFGVINPILVDASYRIIAGHGRYEAARSLGLAEAAVIIVDGLTPAQLKAYALTDNKLHDMSSFDEKLLLEEIEAIQVDSPEFDLTLTGFVTAEIDMMLGTTRTEKINDLQDDRLPPRAKQVVTMRDDLWLCGDRHRAMCGDATSAETMRALIQGDQVKLVASDVPFNTKIEGFVSGLGKHAHRDFEQAAGEMSPDQYVDFLDRSNRAFLPYLSDGALVLQFIDWRHVHNMIEAGERSGFELKNILVWVKGNAGMGSLWRSQHELICAFKYGSAAHTNNIELGVHGRNRSNVLHYPGMNSPVKGRSKALESHATVKPAALIADLILDVTDRRDVVLDPFGGSGTTMIAAERTGRTAYLCEISPAFVDVQIRRWEQLAGAPARLASTGQTLAEVAADRGQIIDREGH